ncbi:hypothetical protein [Priestia flexa]|uniref:hypothetical protein n=1 Tax=Priestia flexa TaxID=86664 RepID=UPI00077C8551|nr:hypothetical protein [Priestia flexa]MED4587859.1 hypothetical protein [Priestia flexa]
MARKDAATKINELEEQMKKIERQLKQQMKKRDEELGKLFREEWGIEDSNTAKLIIDSLKSDVNSLKESLSGNKKDDDINKNKKIQNSSTTVITS